MAIVYDKRALDDETSSPVAKMQKIDDELHRMAEKYADERNIDVSKAYCAVLQSERGRALYAERHLQYRMSQPGAMRQPVEKVSTEIVSKIEANDRLDHLARKIMQANPTLSFQQAYVRGLDTEEGRRLYSAARG